MTDLFEAPVTNEASQREELINKWKDKPIEELLKAKVDADLFINTLTKRQDDLSRDYLELRKQADATASLQALVDKLNEKATSNSATPNANEVKESHEPVDIDKRVKELIEETRRVERQTANANMVQNKLREYFGENNYQSVLQGTGLSNKQINEIAADSPEAIFRLVGLDSKKTEGFQTPPKSSQRNDSFSPKGQTKRDWNYYQELKKTNPKLYLDSKIAIQMHNDAIELGDAFG